jgi:hypothetical protein
MATSAVPGAILALLEILRARPELQQDVDVLDGPPTEDVATQDMVVIGWSPEGDQSADLVQDFNAAGGRTRDEDFNIVGVIDCWTGDDDFAPVRARVFALFGEIEQAVRASGSNPTAPNLNGTVLWAHLTRGVLQQFNTEQGRRAALTFTVTCRARI